jgi:hypothetical protein
MKYDNDRAIHTLLLASYSLPSARQLASAAARKGWQSCALDESLLVPITGPRTFYGGSDRAAEYASRFELSLIEPPLDLVARVPADLLARTVRFGTLAAMRHLPGPIFVKPADPILRSFDAGVYHCVADVRGRKAIDEQTPVLVSEPVEWTAEYRCFIHENKIAAWSPYLSFGRPAWKPASATELPGNLAAFCERLVNRMGQDLPPAFVVDVGVLEDGRWAVVEFNPAWCSSILGANVEAVLTVIERAAIWARELPKQDLNWVRLG